MDTGSARPAAGGPARFRHCRLLSGPRVPRGARSLRPVGVSRGIPGSSPSAAFSPGHSSAASSVRPAPARTCVCALSRRHTPFDPCDGLARPGLQQRRSANPGGHRPGGRDHHAQPPRPPGASARAIELRAGRGDLHRAQVRPARTVAQRARSRGRPDQADVRRSPGSPHAGPTTLASRRHRPGHHRRGESPGRNRSCASGRRDRRPGQPLQRHLERPRDSESWRRRIRG